MKSNLNNHTYDIVNYISELPMADKLEVLAKVFIHLGLSGMLGQEEIIEKDIGVKPTLEIVLDHKRKFGETIDNALAMQGITILGWVNRM